MHTRTYTAATFLLLAATIAVTGCTTDSQAALKRIPPAGTQVTTAKKNHPAPKKMKSKSASSISSVQPSTDGFLPCPGKAQCTVGCFSGRCGYLPGHAICKNGELPLVSAQGACGTAAVPGQCQSCPNG